MAKDNAEKTQKYSGPKRLSPYIFTSDNQPKNKGRRKGSSPTDWLKKLSRTKINFQNPFTGKEDIGEVNLVVAIQLILKATQDSDLPSIREYFDRIDGKVVSKLEGEGFGETKNITQFVFLDNGNIKNTGKREAKKGDNSSAGSRIVLEQ